MILDISIDPRTNEVTVEGVGNHKVGTVGGGMLRWRCEPGQGHKGWTVKFKKSPFVSGETEFGSSKGADGDRLIETDKEKRFKYDVSCTDSQGQPHKADPEVIIWPSAR